MGNIVGSAMGAIPGEGFLTRTLVNHQAGGRTLFSVVVYSGALLAVIWFLNAYLSLIPKPVISGIMLNTGIRIIDAWSVRLPTRLFTGSPRQRKEAALNILIVAAVIAVSLLADLITAVFAGLVLSVIVFFSQMNEDIIRRVYTGGVVHSKRKRSPQCMNLLERHGGGIAALDLEGALFFGSAVAVSDRVDRLAEGKLSFLILDFHRVTRVDASGFRMLQTIGMKLDALGVRLLLSSHSSTSALSPYMKELTRGPAGHRALTFPDADYALQHAEDEVLRAHGIDPSRAGEVALEDCLVSFGFTEAQAHRLAAYFEKRELKSGGVIFREDSTGGSLFIITAGCAEAVISIPDQRRHRRTGTYPPGTMCGETALIDGRPCGVTMRAIEPSTCHRLSRIRFNQMRRKDPSLAFHLMVVISRMSAADLRNAYEVLAEYERG